jgi:electron-transferring-flavoprotein dehydrogenase
MCRSCVLEKGSEVGAHILSGAVVDPCALNELIPDWKEKGAPLNTEVKEDRFFMLGKAGALRLPNFMMPPLMNNHGNYMRVAGQCVPLAGRTGRSAGRRNLSRLCLLGPGLSARTARSRASSPASSASARTAQPGPDYQPGMELHGKYVMIGEGVRGSLAKVLIEKFNLSEGARARRNSASA